MEWRDNDRQYSSNFTDDIFIWTNNKHNKRRIKNDKYGSYRTYKTKGYAVS